MTASDIPLKNIENLSERARPPLKTERFYPRDWGATTVDHFIEVLDSYMRWYNATLIKVSLGSLRPLEYREALESWHNQSKFLAAAPVG